MGKVKFAIVGCGSVSANRYSPQLYLGVFLFMLGAAASLVSAAAPLRAQKGEKRPNFVFILADDWGWGDIACYGHDQLKTPNLDRLAAEGILFTQAYTASPVCSPSRAALMTGRFPAELRIHGHLATPPESKVELNAARGMPNFLDPAILSVTRLLKDAGYVTAFFGKWHLGKAPDAPLPGAYGIDVHRTVDSNEMSWDSADPHFRTHSAELILSKVAEFIRDNRERPFFVQASLLDTHGRLVVTPEQMQPYEHLLGAPRIYYSAVTRVDTEVGRLMARIDELGLRENTIIVFSSDNGPDDFVVRTSSEHAVGSAGPFRGRKTSLYEGGVRVPFIARCPGLIPAGKVDNSTVLSGVDFLPTVCSLAGAQLPAGVDLDGEDLSDTLRGNPRRRSRPLLWEWRFRTAGHVIHRSPRLAIRDGKWKLLMNPDRSRVELYDIPNDPSELNNLADRHPEAVRELSARLLSWHAGLPKGPVQPEAGKREYRWPKGAPQSP